jgi:hypothetical protein
MPGGNDIGYYDLLKQRAAEQLARDDLSPAVKAKIKGDPPPRFPAAEVKNPFVEPEQRPTMAAKPEPIQRTIIKAVCRAWDIPEGELLGEKRAQRQSRPRDAAIWLLRQTGLSLPQVGKIMHRDHTSCMHSERRAKQMFADEADWRRCYQEALTIINSPPQPLAAGEGVAPVEGAPDSGPDPSPRTTQAPESINSEESK